MSEPFRAPNQAETALVEHARAAKDNAYVPYSNFRVGAAIELADGHVVTGCNVENAAYSMAICGERTAMVRLIAEGRDPAMVRSIAVHVDGPDGSPCGACRQFLSEFAPDASITFLQGGEPVSCLVRDLLPGAFNAEALPS